LPKNYWNCYIKLKEYTHFEALVYNNSISLFFLICFTQCEGTFIMPFSDLPFISYATESPNVVRNRANQLTELRKTAIPPPPTDIGGGAVTLRYPSDDPVGTTVPPTDIGDSGVSRSFPTDDPVGTPPPLTSEDSRNYIATLKLLLISNLGSSFAGGIGDGPATKMFPSDDPVGISPPPPTGIGDGAITLRFPSDDPVAICPPPPTGIGDGAITLRFPSDDPVAIIPPPPTGIGDGAITLRFPSDDPVAIIPPPPTGIGDGVMRTMV
jgi:hypothetical protein